VVTPPPGDHPLKRWVFAGGSGRAIYWHVVDLQLKCQSMPLCTLERTPHENTISGLLINSSTLISVGIDKQMVVYKVKVPGAPGQNSRNMKSLKSSGGGGA
jgi:hypothetical protein